MLFKIIAFNDSAVIKIVLKELTGIRSKGFIFDDDTISLSEGYLESSNIRVRKSAARTIIEEVLGTTTDRIFLRLRALAVLKPSISINTNSPIKGQVDLHTHTNLSDAYQTPSALVLDAFESGLDILGVTDHEVFTSEEALIAAKILGIKIVYGVEASCDFEGRETHLLIFGMPERIPYLSIRGHAILHKLHQMEKESEKRARMVKVNLEGALGFDFALTEEEFMGTSRGRPVPMTAFNAVWKKNPAGMLRIMPDCTSGKDFFVRYVKKSRPDIYTPVDRRFVLSLEEALYLAVELSGIVILAHPNELDKDNNDNSIAVMKRLIKMARSQKFFSPNGHHTFAGVENYSHKSRQSGIFQAVLDAVEELNREQGDPLILFPGSDYHGKYSLPAHPLGHSEGYPEDDSAIRNAISYLVI